MLILRRRARLFAAIPAAVVLIIAMTGTSPVSAVVTEGALVIGKSASPITYDHAGQVITYTYTLQNVSPYTFGGTFTITDDKIGDFPCGGAPTMLAHGSPIVTCNNPQQYVITDADIAAGSVTNSAYAVDGTYRWVSNMVSATTVFAQASSPLVLTKTADTLLFDHVGQVITYTYTIRWTGSGSLDAPFTITDDKLGSFACGGAPALLPGGGPAFTCNNPQTYTVTQADADAGSVTNTAVAVGGANHVASNAVSYTVAYGPAGALALGKAADRYTYDHAGQVIHYTYTIQNVGSSAIDGPFTVTDDKTGTFGCAGAPSPLYGGQAWTCTNAQAYTITAQDMTNGSVTNTAVAVNGDSSIVSNNVSVTVTFVAAPGLTLTKSGTVPIVAPGQLVQYTFVMTNTGNAPLGLPYTINDPLLGPNWYCPSTPDPLEMGHWITCVGYYTLSAQDILAGSLTNTATASAKYGSTTITSHPASATVSWTPPQPPAVVSVKRAGTSPMTSASNVAFIVTFSKPVSGVNATAPFSDFRLTARGLTGAAITAVTGISLTAYRVVVNRGTGSGMLRLDVIDDGSIVDLDYGLPLGGAGSGNGNFTAGQPYWIAPMPQSPSGTITDPTPTFKWTKLEGVTQYRVELRRGTTVVYSVIVPAAVCGTTTCSFTSLTRLSPASYTWRVRAFAAGAWRIFSPYKSFTLLAP